MEVSVNSVIGVRQKIACVKGGVLFEPAIRFFNFYTCGNVAAQNVREREKKTKIEMILIDGGAVVDLMPEGVAKKLNLELISNTDIII